MIEKIRFRILWTMAWLFGKSPRLFQYAVSDFISFVLFHLVKYRRKVVEANLRNSFPEKSEKERREIERKFYRHLGDIFVETIALSAMSEKELKRRLVYDNKEVVDKASADRPMIAAMSHFCQWEYTIGYQMFTPNPVKAVYHPLSSNVAEMFYKKMRSRFGTKPVTMKAVAREVLREVEKGHKPIVALIADQTPAYPSIKNFITFLNQPTAFFTGMETLALRFGMSVVFMAIRKTEKRGFYRAKFILLYDGLESVGEDVITRRYAHVLEEQIKESPECWIWSHRRWKHNPDEKHPYIQ